MFFYLFYFVLFIYFYDILKNIYENIVNIYYYWELGIGPNPISIIIINQYRKR